MYIIIIGCGRIGSELARLLSSEGHDVVIIDKNPEAFKRLGGGFNGLTLVGNGFDLELLKEAGIKNADAFCAVTNGDNTNIMASQIAKKIFNIKRVVARVYDPKRAEIYKALGLDILSGTVLFAAMMRDKLIESRFSSYLIESGEVGVMEVKVDGGLKGKKICDINIADELLVATVIKKEGVIIPRAETVLERDDILMVVVRISSLSKIRDIFKLSQLNNLTK